MLLSQLENVTVNDALPFEAAPDVPLSI